MTYTNNNLRQLFQNAFNLEEWTSVLRDYFHATTLRTTPERIEGTADNEAGYFLGSLDTSDNYNIGFFHYRFSGGDVSRRRVSLRTLVRQFVNPRWGEFDAALVVFDDGHHWRLSFVSDIKGEATAPKRYTFVFGDKDNYYNTPVSRFLKLQTDGISFANLREAFSVEALSKDFYNDLYKWYEWALSDEVNVTFPNNPDTVSDDRENINVKLIRLITRLLFVWFIKQKRLVPDRIFDTNYLQSILKDFSAQSANDGCFYNAILQNLFFATLNCAIVDEEGMPRRFADDLPSDTRNLYRYDEMFSIGKDDILSIFAQVPFLNGGLFECLDKPKDLYINLDHDILFDGFSRKEDRAFNGNFKYRAFVPNILFFNNDEKHLGLINLLKRYNFTIEENKPNDAEVSLDPELLGRVFENLLAAYNPETQESARKSTGSFYTPRVIVDYMVDEALKSYILKAGIEGINSENIGELFTDECCPSQFTEQQREELVAALKRVKILDPACGSGAFPMGCLLRVVSLAQHLLPNSTDKYALKLEIIENCVFGVDIQPIAMLICKLRFFISLICEQENIDFNSPKTNFGINTLPNLETKFVAANSLISADIRCFEDDWTRDSELLRMKDDLLGVRREHFGAKGRKAKREEERQDERSRNAIQEYILKTATHPDKEKIEGLEHEVERLKAEGLKYEEEIWVDTTQPIQHDLFGVVQNQGALFREDINKKKRDEIKAQLSGVERELKKERAKGVLAGFEAAVKQITEWNPYDQNSVSPFFDPEWMFCMDGKFDIVIGNPPYIQLQNNGGELAALYADCGYQTFARTGDIYCLFYERGIQLLRQDGHLCYITSNKWMRAGYGEKTRAFFAKNNPQLLIDFAGVKVFESATVDTNILLLQKADNAQQTRCAVANKKDGISNMSLFVRQCATISRFTDAGSWVILSPIEQSIKAKIEAVGTPLRDWDINIYRGVLTGCNDAFIINTEKRNEILANCATEDERKRTAELIRPILRGRDIKRYAYEWAGLYLIFVPWHFPLHLDPSIKGCSEKAENAFKEQYPAVYAHLLQYKDMLSKRNKAETGIRYEWYALQRWGANYWEDFQRPKIVYPDIMRLPRSVSKMKLYPYFYLDEKGYIPEATLFMMTGDKIKLICNFLCSDIGFFIFTKYYMGPVFDDTGFRYKKEYLLKLPIPTGLSDGKDNYEHALAEAIGLSDEERKMIDTYKNDIICVTFENKED